MDSTFFYILPLVQPLHLIVRRMEGESLLSSAMYFNCRHKRLVLEHGKKRENVPDLLSTRLPSAVSNNQQELVIVQIARLMGSCHRAGIGNDELLDIVNMYIHHHSNSWMFELAVTIMGLVEQMLKIPCHF